MIFGNFFDIILRGKGGKIILIQQKKEIPKGKLLSMVTLAVAIQGNLKEYILPYAVAENNNIYQTGIEKNSPLILWGNATIVDFESCIDPINNSSIIYL